MSVVAKTLLCAWVASIASQAAHAAVNRAQAPPSVAVNADGSTAGVLRANSHRVDTATSMEVTVDGATMTQQSIEAADANLADEDTSGSSDEADQPIDDASLADKNATSGSPDEATEASLAEQQPWGNGGRWGGGGFGVQSNGGGGGGFTSMGPGQCRDSRGRQYNAFEKRNWGSTLQDCQRGCLQYGPNECRGVNYDHYGPWAGKHYCQLRMEANVGRRVNGWRRTWSRGRGRGVVNSAVASSDLSHHGRADCYSRNGGGFGAQNNGGFGAQNFGGFGAQNFGGFGAQNNGGRWNGGGFGMQANGGGGTWTNLGMGYCRGNHAMHNPINWYIKTAWSVGNTLSLCQQQCQMCRPGQQQCAGKNIPAAFHNGCVGIEYAHGTFIQNHCELWIQSPQTTNRTKSGAQTAVCYVYNRAGNVGASPGSSSPPASST